MLDSACVEGGLELRVAEGGVDLFVQHYLAFDGRGAGHRGVGGFAGVEWRVWVGRVVVHVEYQDLC